MPEVSERKRGHQVGRGGPPEGRCYHCPFLSYKSIGPRRRQLTICSCAAGDSRLCESTARAQRGAPQAHKRKFLQNVRANCGLARTGERLSPQRSPLGTEVVISSPSG